MKFEQLKKELQALHLPRGSYVIIGSGPLVVRGIREAQDLDVIVNEQEYQRLLKEYPQDNNKHPYGCITIGNLELGRTWKGKQQETKKLLQEAEIIDGLPFTPLETIIAWKKEDMREKDKKDLELIKAYQEKHKTLIAQGAEAKIFLTKEPIITKNQEASHNKTVFIKKTRIPKSYRHPTLDEQLRKKRTRAESKLLHKAREAGIPVPRVLATHEHELELEYLEGERLSETLNNHPEKKQYTIMNKLGEQTTKLHEQNIIHADLTTSNTILKNNDVYLIDFGLGFISNKLEDKAVDLHLIKQALEAKHYQNHQQLYEAFLKKYNPKEKTAILKRLEEVEKRGRHRH